MSFLLHCILLKQKTLHTIHIWFMQKIIIVSLKTDWLASDLIFKTTELLSSPTVVNIRKYQKKLPCLLVTGQSSLLWTQ